MKALLVLCLISFSFVSLAERNITLFVDLTPAGSFQAVSKKAKGNIFKQGNGFISEQISVNIESFKTGIDLRDEHTWKHMNYKKHPKAILTNVKAQGGKGTATLELNGKKQPINIVYKVVGQDIKAQFAVKASSFGLPKAEYLGVGVNDVIKVRATLPYRAK